MLDKKAAIKMTPMAMFASFIQKVMSFVMQTVNDWATLWDTGLNARAVIPDEPVQSAISRIIHYETRKIILLSFWKWSDRPMIIR